MKAEALATYPMPWLTALGLVIFFTFFVGMLIWINRRRSGELYRALSVLPLGGPAEAVEDARNESEGRKDV